MHSHAVVEEGGSAAFDIEGIEILAEMSRSIAFENDAVGFGVETKYFQHLKRPFGELTQFFAVGIEQVEVVEAVAARLHDEFRGVPREESDGVLRLDVAVVALGVEDAEACSGVGIIFHEVGTILRAGHFKHINALPVGTPSDVGKIAVGGVAGIEPNGAIGSGVEDTHRDFVARHSCHRVFVGSRHGHTIGFRHLNVHEWIVRHHRLVHTVERQAAAVGAPERAFVDAELIAVHARAVEEFAVAVGRYGMSAAVGGEHIEVVGFGIGQ